MFCLARIIYNPCQALLTVAIISYASIYIVSIQLMFILFLEICRDLKVVSMLIYFKKQEVKFTMPFLMKKAQV